MPAEKMIRKLYCGSRCAAAVRLVVSVVVVGMAVLALYHQHAPTRAPTSAIKVKSTPLSLTTHQIYLPEFPNMTRPDQPADIPTRFLLEEATACHRIKDVELVAYVHSAISRVEHRRETRRTWANSTALRMVVMFMVGRSKNRHEQELIERESFVHHDIVQGDYADYYRLLSYKALSSLYWITKHCAHVPWTVHADDDILIDTFRLRQFIQGQNGSKDRDKLHCRKLVKQPVKRKGKWSVSPSELALKHYPPYCEGFFWLLPTTQVSILLQASAHVKFMWVDDAYVTGFMAIKANISIHDIKNLKGGATMASAQVGTNMVWVHLKKRSLQWPRILHHYRVSGSP